jgi:hypothetical protein
LPATAKQLDPDLASHLAARQEQEPCEVVVLSLVDTRQTKLPAMELALGAQAGKFPVAPQPDYDISKAAEQRMTLAVQQLARQISDPSRPLVGGAQAAGQAVRRPELCQPREAWKVQSSLSGPGWRSSW